MTIRGRVRPGVHYAKRPPPAWCSPGWQGGLRAMPAAPGRWFPAQVQRPLQGASPGRGAAAPKTKPGLKSRVSSPKGI